MRRVRLGVIGLGGMGQAHCASLKKLEEAELTAVSDIAPEVAREVGEEHQVPYFARHTDLLDSGLVEAVLIATTHYFHPPIAIDAFKRGLHVLSEKPIAVTVKEARRMIRAAETSGKVFGVMYQMRTQPAARAARRLIAEGHLGELTRASMVIEMYRSQAYYDSGGWRATWKGEGGGVLLNQAPHGLDLFAWLAGMPKFIIAQTRTRMHDIEVEDEAFAMMEFPNGAHGYLYASTDTAPDQNRIEICGDRGKLILDERSLQFWEVDPPLREFTRENSRMWAQPQSRLVEVPLPDCEVGHAAITRNFCRAILEGEELLAPGREGIWAVELANAMTLSSNRGGRVRLPVPGAEYEELLEKLKRRSKPKRAARSKRETDPQHLSR